MKVFERKDADGIAVAGGNGSVLEVKYRVQIKEKKGWGKGISVMIYCCTFFNNMHFSFSQFRWGSVFHLP